MTNMQAALIAAATAYDDYAGVPDLAWEWAEALDRMDAERAADLEVAREAEAFDVARCMGSTCPSDAADLDVYIPFRWADEMARYECANGHPWTKDWTGLPGKGRYPKARGQTLAALLGDPMTGCGPSSASAGNGERTPTDGAP